MHTLQDAQEALIDEDRERAKAICLDLVARREDLFEANTILAELALHGGDPGKAFGFLEAAHDANPGDRDVLFQLAGRAIAAKDWKLVVKYCGRIAAMPDSEAPKQRFTALLNLVVGLLHLGRREDAVAPARDLKRLLENPDLEAYAVRATQDYCFSILARVLYDDDLATKAFHAGRYKDVKATVADIVSTREWCLANDAPYHVVDPPQEMAVRCGSGGLDAWRYHGKGTFFARIPGGRTIPRWDFVKTPDGQVLKDSGYSAITHPTAFAPHYADAVLLTSTILHLTPPKTATVDEDVLFLSCPSNFHPTHWLLDFLPRLRALGLTPPGSRLKLATPAGLPQRNKDFLKYFGVSEDDLFLCREDTLYTFRNVYVFGFDTSERPVPANVSFLGDAFRGAPPTPMRQGARYYLTRASATTRKVWNAEDLDRLLAKHGFETVDLALVSVADMAKMRDAEMLLGPTGSNLVAFLFVNQGCPVIELIPDPSHNVATGPHCRMLDLEHEFVLCGTRYAKPTDDTLTYDLVVDCDKLDALIQARLAHRR